MRRGGMSKAPLVMIGALVMFLVYMQYNTGTNGTPRSTLSSPLLMIHARTDRHCGLVSRGG